MEHQLCLPLDALLGILLGRLGVFLGRLGALLGRYGAVLGWSGGPHGPIWDQSTGNMTTRNSCKSTWESMLFALLGPLKASWRPLGPSWAVLGPSWAVSEPSWSLVGPSWGHGPPVRETMCFTLFSGGGQAAEGIRSG